MITLAKTQERLVDLEGLLQVRDQKQLDAAIDGLSAEQSLVLLMFGFLGRDQPGPPAMDKRRCAAWLRAGMQEAGLPRHVRPMLAQVQAMAQRFMAAVDAGDPVPDDLVDWCVWLHELGHDEASAAHLS